jgi:nicotinamidase-related amidase
VASVINLLHYRNNAEQPALILAGLHQLDQPGFDWDVLKEVLGNCKAALASARSSGIPVAFVRCITPPLSVSEPRAYPAWLKGFEPTRNDMVFDVLQPSCYSNAEFSRAMEYSNGNFVIAGLFAETTCLSTAIDAYHRRHNFTYLSDASACRNNGAFPALLFHDAISHVISVYGNTMEVAQWRLSLRSSRSLQYRGGGPDHHVIT